MKLNRSTDIIRQNNQDYVNVNSDKRLIAQLIGTSAEAVYDFHIPFGNAVDKKTVEEMKGTYWMRVTKSDNVQYDDNIQVAVL